MLHSSAACAFSDVQDKCVVLKRRTTHQFYFVLADAPQFIFDAVFPPVVAVNHHGDSRRHPRQIKLLEIADFDRTIRKGIVSRRHEKKCSHASRKVNPAGRGACWQPIFRWIGNAEHHFLRPPFRGVQQDHRRIDKRVFAVQLSPKRPDFVPVRSVANGDCAVSLDLPRLLIHFFKGRFF